MNLPDSFIDSKMFVYFINYFCQNAPILSRDCFISNYLPTIMDESIKYRDKKLEESTYLTLMLDTYTDKSDINKMGIICVNEKRERIVISMDSCLKFHTSEDVVFYLNRKITEHNICNKLIAICSDGEPVINKAREKLCNNNKWISCRCLIHHLSLLI